MHAGALLDGARRLAAFFGAAEAAAGFGARLADAREPGAAEAPGAAAAILPERAGRFRDARLAALRIDELAVLAVLAGGRMRVEHAALSDRVAKPQIGRAHV